MYTYTICFLKHANEYLLLNRRKPPLMGRWNGVGGKLAPNESPLDCVLREVFETMVHRITANEIDDVRVRLLGDAAVVTGHTHGPGKHNEVAYDVSSRFTDVFVRREGR